MPNYLLNKRMHKTLENKIYVNIENFYNLLHLMITYV